MKILGINLQAIFYSFFYENLKSFFLQIPLSKQQGYAQSLHGPHEVGFEGVPEEHLRILLK